METDRHCHCSEALEQFKQEVLELKEIILKNDEASSKISKQISSQSDEIKLLRIHSKVTDSTEKLARMTTKAISNTAHFISEQHNELMIKMRE